MRNGEKHGFVMDSDDIEVEDTGRSSTTARLRYYPSAAEPGAVDLARGDSYHLDLIMGSTLDRPQYEMTLSLNVLRHLGFGLYSNIAAVLSEVVANSWDADAKHVKIAIDANASKVVIEDDGHGMTIEDANQKYLVVGYERRKTEGQTPTLNRPVMGRKGIVKLSLFSIARTVRIRTNVPTTWVQYTEPLFRILPQHEAPTPVDWQASETPPAV